VNAVDILRQRRLDLCELPALFGQLAGERKLTAVAMGFVGGEPALRIGEMLAIALLLDIKPRVGGARGRNPRGGARGGRRTGPCPFPPRPNTGGAAKSPPPPARSPAISRSTPPIEAITLSPSCWRCTKVRISFISARPASLRSE